MELVETRGKLLDSFSQNSLTAIDLIFPEETSAESISLTAVVTNGLSHRDTIFA